MDKADKGKDYLLRAVPLELYRDARHLALDLGMPFRELLLQAIREIMESYEKEE
jgi:hypothetical protein